MSKPETINPFMLWQGSFIPNWIMQRPELPASAKIIYGRLCQFAGRDGVAYPSTQTLADETGISRRQVVTLLNKLEKLGLIRRCKRATGDGSQTSTLYEFLKHEWASTPRENTSHPPVNSTSHPPVNSTSHPPVNSTSHEEVQVLRESVLSSFSLGERDLSLDDDTPTNRFIKAFQHKRPTAGHPLAKLNATEIQETRLRIKEFIDWVGENRIDELVDAIFLPKRPKPTTIKQALLFASKIVEKEEKAQAKKENQNATDTNKPKLWSQRIQQWEGREADEARASERNAERINALLERNRARSQNVA